MTDEQLKGHFDAIERRLEKMRLVSSMSSDFRQLGHLSPELAEEVRNSGLFGELSK